MFASGSPYSPFFTSGLMSTSTESIVIPPIRRGSLPTTSTDNASRSYTAHEDSFMRSFLSLDLAESQSMRSASLKRKPTLEAYVFPQSKLATVPSRPTTPAKSLRIRFSRDSLRSVPSPKPAPSINLPDLPQAASSPAPEAPPRLPSLQPLPALDLSLPAISVSISRTSAPRAITTLKKTSSSRLPPHLSFAKHRFSVATKATSSTVSTHARKFNRSEALARLEGRSAPPVVKKPSYLGSNFMSMSDDEDEDEEIEFQIEEEDIDAHGDDEDEQDSDLDSLDIELDDFPSPTHFLLDPILEPEDVVLPLSTPGFLEAPRSAPLPPRRTSSPPLERSRTPNPPAPKSSPIKRQRTVKRGSKDWFPLQSFIDLHADEDRSSSVKSKESSSAGTRSSSNWSWRSFIEVANVV